VPVRRRSWPLTWRGAVLAAVAMGAVTVLAAATMFAVVRDSLRESLWDALAEDATKVAALYATGGAGSARELLQGPTGGVWVQFYDPLGELLVASEPRFAEAAAAIPLDVVLGARDASVRWRGTLLGGPVQGALMPFTLGVVAIVGDATFIGDALARLTRDLVVVALALVAVSAVVGWAVAAAIVRPVRRLARAAQRLDPERLEPIPDPGPRDEVGRLTEVLNALLERLRAAMGAQRTFLAETSHELRTPLTSLQGFLERASRRAQPDVRRDLDDARRVAAGMSRLVTDLLQLSRGEVVREVDPFLVDPVADVLAPVAEEWPGVRVEGQAGASVVLGDPARLRQLMRNLTANAVRAAGEAGVVLRARVDGDEAVLEVHDDGPGVPEELRAKVFEKFWTSGGGGAGLGLAIARQIAAAHGSALTLESRPGATTFAVRLPRMELGDEDDA
jgi:two-component system, OmpR family, sensor kinase